MAGALTRSARRRMSIQVRIEVLHVVAQLLDRAAVRRRCGR